MVSVELSHNPYLLETKVLFNGRPPRVNSAIEKYERQPLVDWAREVPRILHDEMNGYDFDLEFSGTVSDFERLKVAFAEAGVKGQSVRLHHSQSLENVNVKRVEVAKTIAWLKGHPNRQFDFGTFSHDNVDLMVESFPLVMLFAPAVEEAPGPLSAEEIGSVDELDSTDLTGSPILIFISISTAAKVRAAIPKLISRSDVTRQQLFFVLSPALNKSQAVRTLSDLGLGGPQIVQGPSDTAIVEYAESHLLTEGVRAAISAFESSSAEIGLRLDEETARCEVLGASGRSKIDALEEEISKLKEAGDALDHLPNYGMPRDFLTAKSVLNGALRGWRVRKTKISADDEAANWAAEYEKLIRSVYKGFSSNVDTAYRKAKRAIEVELSRTYRAAGIDPGFSPTGGALPPLDCPELPDVRSVMLDLKEVSLVEQRNDFFGLFSQGTPDENGMVRVVAYPLDSWRDKASEIVAPLAQATIAEGVNALRSFRIGLASAYKAHIETLVEERLAQKEESAAKLSDDEKHLQSDKDWLSEFKDRLQTIERG